MVLRARVPLEPRSFVETRFFHVFPTHWSHRGYEQTKRCFNLIGPCGLSSWKKSNYQIKCRQSHFFNVASFACVSLYLELLPLSKCKSFQTPEPIRWTYTIKKIDQMQPIDNLTRPSTILFSHSGPQGSKRPYVCQNMSTCVKTVKRSVLW